MFTIPFSNDCDVILDFHPSRISSRQKNVTWFVFLAILKLMQSDVLEGLFDKLKCFSPHDDDDVDR